MLLFSFRLKIVCQGTFAFGIPRTLLPCLPSKISQLCCLNFMALIEVILYDSSLLLWVFKDESDE